MDVSQLVDLATNNGLTILLVAYFLLKDWTFNNQIISTLTGIREVLVALQTWHASKEDKK